jgi:hypothetical protein
MGFAGGWDGLTAPVGATIELDSMATTTSRSETMP